MPLSALYVESGGKSALLLPIGVRCGQTNSLEGASASVLLGLPVVGKGLHLVHDELDGLLLSVWRVAMFG